MNLLFGAFAAALISAQPDTKDVVEKFRLAYETIPAYTVEWRSAEEYGGSLDELRILIGLAPDAAPFRDSATGANLWILHQGMVSVAEGGRTFTIRSWPVRAFSIDNNSKKTEIFSPSAYSLIKPGSDSQAQLIPSNQRFLDNPFDLRDQNELGPEELGITREFMALVRYAARYLPVAPDLAVLSEDERAVTVASKALGITCTLQRDSGVCTAATYRPPRQNDPIRWEVLDSFLDPLFPAPHPSLVRMESTVFGDRSIKVFIYGTIEQIPTDPAMFDWATYANIAHNRVDNTIVRPDGDTQEDVQPRRFPNPPQPVGNSSRVDANSQDGTEIPPIRPAPPMPVSPLRIVLFVCGGALVMLFAGVSIWRKVRG